MVQQVHPAWIGVVSVRKLENTDVGLVVRKASTIMDIRYRLARHVTRTHAETADCVLCSANIVHACILNTASPPWPRRYFRAIRPLPRFPHRGGFAQDLFFWGK